MNTSFIDIATHKTIWTGVLNSIPRKGEELIYGNSWWVQSVRWNLNMSHVFIEVRRDK